MTTVIVTTEDSSIVEFDAQAASKLLVDAVLSGSMDQVLEDAELTNSGTATVQCAPIEKDLPDWYNGNGENVLTLYRELGCTEEEYNAGQCEAINNMNLDTIDTYAKQDAVNNEELAGEAEAVELAVPKGLVLLNQPTGSQLAGGAFYDKISVAMIDSNDEVMATVGLPTDPWKVQITFISSDNGNNVFMGSEVAEFKFSGGLTGKARFSDFGIMNPDTNVTLRVEMMYPTEYDIQSAEISGFDVLGFSVDGVDCPTDEGENPVSYDNFSKHSIWGAGCYSVCSLPCGDDSNELECVDTNTCGHELMTCSGENTCDCVATETPSEIANFASLTCGAESMSLRINKCAIQSHGLGLPDLFMNGLEFNMRSQGRHNCYGFVDYSGEGIDYVWNVDFDKCGTANKTNSLKALTNDFTSGVEQANSFWIQFGCDEEDNGIVEVSLDSTDAGPVVKTMKKSMTLDIDAAYQSRVETVSYIEKLTVLEGSEYYYSDVEINNLVTGTNVNDGRSTVLVAQDCKLSSSADPSSAEGVAFIENSCPVGNYAVEMIRNAKGSTSKFIVGPYDFPSINPMGKLAFVHCQLRLCDTNSETCTPEC